MPLHVVGLTSSVLMRDDFEVNQTGFLFGFFEPAAWIVQLEPPTKRFPIALLCFGST